MHLILELILDTTRFSPYLIRSKQTLINKIKILLTYLRLTVKLVLLSKIFRLKNEKIFGFKVRGFNYRSIHLLFRVIFLWHIYFFKTNKRNPLIFDCGANIGLATLFFKWLYPNSEVHAFEPDKETFNLLKKNVEQNNLDDVYLYNAALSDKNGRADFYIDKQKPGSCSMSVKERTPEKIRMPDKTTVDTTALSKVIQDIVKDKEIDFLKVNIEGAEETVILDLSKNDKLKNVKEMVIEYHHKIAADERAKLAQFLKLLEDNGFEYQIDASCLPFYSQDKFQSVLIYAYKRGKFRNLL